MSTEYPMEVLSLDCIPRLASYLKLSSAAETRLLRNALYPPMLCQAAANGDTEALKALSDDVRTSVRFH